MAKICLIAYLVFFIDQKKRDIIEHYNKFPNYGVYRASFPNLKGPRAPSQNCKKRAVKRDFRPYIRQYTSPNENL